MLMQWFKRFMHGRYGADPFNRFLSVLSLVLLLLSMFIGWSALHLLAMISLLYTLFRALSRNTWQRNRENQIYLQAKGKVTAGYSIVKTRYQQRKTYSFFKCQSCHTTLRVPKGRGRVKITCPQCHISFESRT